MAFPRQFDLVHGHALLTCLKDPAALFRQAFDALRPGGWLEMQDVANQEFERPTKEGKSLRVIHDHIDAFTARTGYRWTNVPRYKQLMETAGFVDVVAKRYRWPSNPDWIINAAAGGGDSAGDEAGTREKEVELGRLFLEQYDAGMLENTCSRMFLKGLGWSKERLDELLAKVYKELRDPDIHAFSPV